MKEEKKNNVIPWWVKSIISLTLTGVFSYKIIQTPVTLQFDFPSFLSLLLALFSVGLAAMFYFKTTDTSNTFYDNTYKFTRDIAELLVRIESGFGERLRHLDEAYKGMQDRFDKLPSKLQISEAKEKVEKEEKELEKIIREKEELIEELVSKAQLRDEEKQQFLNALKEKEEALNDARQELNFLRRRLRIAEQKRIIEEEEDIIPVHSPLRSYIMEHILPQMDPEYVATRPAHIIKRRFSQIKDELHDQAIRDMERYGLINSNGDLTVKGTKLFKSYALRML